MATFIQMQYLWLYSYGWNTCGYIHKDAIPMALFIWMEYLGLYSYGWNTYLGIHTDGISMAVFMRMKYLTTPVATSMKHPTKRPVDGGFPEGSLLTFDMNF